MSKLEELRKEAAELGIKFSPNIGETKLADKIEAHYASIETNEKAIEAAITAKEMEEVEGEVMVRREAEKAFYQKVAGQRRAKEAERDARKTRVVEVIDNDPRFNSHTTTVSATCGNEHFDLGTVIYPLNLPVEMMQGHISSLQEIVFPHHQIDQKTGVSKHVMRKRYTVSFTDLKAQ